MISIKQINYMKSDVENGKNPRDIKAEFAIEIVERFHSKSLALSALNDFESRFRYGNIPERLDEQIFNDKDLNLVSVLKKSGMSASFSEAIRNIEQGGVKIDGVKVTDRNMVLNKGNFILQVGKRKFLRIKIN